MIGQDKLADERKKRMFSEMRTMINEEALLLRFRLVKYASSIWTDANRANRFLGLRMTIHKEMLDSASDDLNATLRPEFSAIDGMDTEAQHDAAARMKARIDSNLNEAGFDGMRVQIQLQPARARLVKVEM